MLIDPTSSYAKAAAAAMGRSMDDVIITALNADAADTGVAGGTLQLYQQDKKLVLLQTKLMD
jgi:hypothetical protein